jgi:hypothetical protein
MDIKISEEKLKRTLQNLIDGSIESIRVESEDWGLGEMDELQEIESVNKIVIDRIISDGETLQLYVDVYTNSRRQEFDNILGQIQYDLNQWFPRVSIFENEIVNDWSVGFGTEW